jgi:leucyl aminopeptidase
MTANTNGYNVTPTIEAVPGATIGVARATPAQATAVGIPVGESGAVPRQIGLDRAALAASGFEGKVGQALTVPRADGAALIATGIGKPGELDVAKLRDAAAAFARAAGKHNRLATTLVDVSGVNVEDAGRAVVEGVLLARYRYDAFKHFSSSAALSELTLVTSATRSASVSRGAHLGQVFASAAMLARDLANAPPAYLTASRMADVATTIAQGTGLGIEVFDKDALIEMGCGGLLGVNAGSTEPPRMIRLTYRPQGGNGRSARSNGHLAMVGKGVMYDSGGISLKPSDAVHATMKQDMSGAGAILAAMSALAALDCKTAVTGYLMCTDNMPSGSATKLGDILTIRGGKTVEVLNTDAEGRLLLADGLVLATEEQPQPDAIVDIATLTGACLRALGPSTAGVFGNNRNLNEQVSAAADHTDESVWELPLDWRYRKELDSDIADIKNMGGPNGGAIHAALFLAEFVGDVPWVHLDIAGPVLGESDESWRPKGATGYGARLLLDMALNFAPPAASSRSSRPAGRRAAAR